MTNPNTLADAARAATLSAGGVGLLIIEITIIKFLSRKAADDLDRLRDTEAALSSNKDGVDR